MKGIECCGDCVYYDYQKHSCRRGAHIDTEPASEFFADCPLPDVQHATKVQSEPCEIEIQQPNR